VQVDPIGYQGGSNLYAYVGNDPLNLLDPFGLVQDRQGGWGGLLQDVGRYLGTSADALSRMPSGLAGMAQDLVTDPFSFLQRAGPGLVGLGMSVPIVGASGAAESSVWALPPTVRGQLIGEALGHNMPGNYPVVDRFVGGLATSIKSIDLNAASYQNTATLSGTLTRYIDQVANFSGRTWAGAEIRAADITGRALDLAVPNVGSTSQQSVLSQAVRYGGQRGVTVNVIPYP
jgi:hypothetical protein